MFRRETKESSDFRDPTPSVLALGQGRWPGQIGATCFPVGLRLSQMDVEEGTCSLMGHNPYEMAISLFIDVYARRSGACRADSLPKEPIPTLSISAFRIATNKICPNNSASHRLSLKYQPKSSFIRCVYGSGRPRCVTAFVDCLPSRMGGEAAVARGLGDSLMRGDG